MKKVTIKKVLQKNKYPNFFGEKYKFSPYKGCGHGCLYCDGRYEKYNFNPDENIEYKHNCPELLLKELPKLREKGPILISSGISDPYPPIEKKLRLTQKCLLSLQNYDKIILTKSTIPIDDLNLLANKNTILLLSIVFTNDALSKSFEPCVKPASERFKMIETFKKAGAYAGISAMPFIPYINDDEKSLNIFCEKLKQVNADFAIPGTLTLKKGIQKQTFLNHIKKNFSDIYEKIEKIYSDNYWHGGGNKNYFSKVWHNMFLIWKKHKISPKVPHKIYKNKFQFYDEIYSLLSDMQLLYSIRNINVKKLYEAKKQYKEWLNQQKMYISRRRNLSYNLIDEQIKEMLLANKFSRVINNPKLNNLLKHLCNDNVYFDYTDLKLKNF